MTKHSVARWYHLAIAAVVPLVLTVCVTPSSISQLGDLNIDVDAPSATALAAVEPGAPALPLIEVAAAPRAVQPALDAGLLGLGGVATVTPHIEPERPPHPVRLAVVPMDEVGVPGMPVGVGADGTPEQGEYVMPTRPRHPALLVKRITVPGRIGVPVGTGTGGAPALGAQGEPERPPHPERSELLASVPMGEVGVPGMPVGVGTHGTPEQREYVMPTRPRHPALLVKRTTVPGEIGVPVGTGTGGAPALGAQGEPERPPHPERSELLASVPMGEVGVPGMPVGVGTHGTPEQREYVMPTRPRHPALLVKRTTVPGEIGVPVGAGTGGAPALGAQVEPERPPHPERSELLASVPMSALGEPAAPATADGADAVRGRAGLVPPTTPPHPVMVAAVPVSLTYPQPASAGGPSIIQPPTDADFDRVRVLIARAEEVGAQFYDPQNLDGAREALGTTERIRGVDPGGSHVGLRVAEARANAAFENSVRLAAERLRNLLQNRLEELREIQADLWVPVSFQELVDAVQRTEELFQSGDLFGAYRLALATLDDMLALRDALLDRLELLHGARAETERCLTAAQQLDTSHWSASRLEELRSLYQQLNELYLTGLEAIRAYRLTDAEEAFGAAIEVCRRLMAVADDAYTEQMERAAELLTAVMEEIEEASRLHVVTDLGDVIRPQPWSGQPVLDALRAGPARRKAILDGIDPEDPNLLHKAQGLWIEGVAAFDDQKYGQSIRLFEDARRYLDLYKFYAVLGIHVVQLIPERRESLWRIAEYPRWYDDPFLWPRIWRRNRDLIQNPDLIYPGWQLIIPAL